MRKILEIVTGKQIDLSENIDLNAIKIKRLWTVYNEQEMWEQGNPNHKINPSLDELVLKHNEGVFLEDYIHDWLTRNGKLDYYSRVVEQGIKIKILIEYEIVK